MEEYKKSNDFSQNEKHSKKDIFMYANNNSNTAVLLGLIDGIILRDDNINILNGLIKQYKNLLSEEDLMLSIEHACLLHKPEHVKTISNFIKNNELYIDSYNYINKKDKNCCKYIEKFIDNYIITENNFISDEDDIDNISEFTNIENSIKNININIDNLNINVYNIHLTNDYFNKVTNPNIINL